MNYNTVKDVARVDREVPQAILPCLLFAEANLLAAMIGLASARRKICTGSHGSARMNKPTRDRRRGLKEDPKGFV